MITLDETHDPHRRSWIESANTSNTDFPIQNLPIGMFSLDGRPPRCGMAIGDAVLDIGIVHDKGWFTGDAAVAAEAAINASLNDLFSLGRGPLRELRRQAASVLAHDGPVARKTRVVREGLLHARDACAMQLPVRVGNYTDFYAGIYHAKAAGALLTPEDPLPKNYKWVPIAYHGRASSVGVGGGMIKHPYGQRPPTDDGRPSFGPSERLDFELEMGFFIGKGNALGQPIDIASAGEHIVGFTLLNDWSARDIQRWEMFPLGPFLSKNFSTSISPWIVTADALLPFRMPTMVRDAGDPAPLDYLLNADDQQHGGVDVALSVQLQTAQMRDKGLPAVEILHSNARHLFWTPAQMIAHHTCGGCDLQPGDLIGTGTISGPEPDQLSSMLELTAAGSRPITLPNGEQRGFLEDGDEVVFMGKCHRDGFVSIGFGELRGRITA